MSESKTTLILVHGASRLSRPTLMEKWVPSLEQALGNTWKIVLPMMPNPESPKAEVWLRAVAETIEGIDGHVFLAGHSLGGSVLLQFVARKLPRLDSLFVVASPFWCGEDSDWQYEPFKLTDRDIEILQPCRITFYHGTADDIVPYSHMAEYHTVFPQAEIRTYNGMNHSDPFDTFLQELAMDILFSMDRDNKSLNTDAENGAS